MGRKGGFEALLARLEALHKVQFLPVLPHGRIKRPCAKDYPALPFLPLLGVDENNYYV